MKKLFIVLLCTAAVASIVWCVLDYGTTKSVLTVSEDENIKIEESCASQISLEEADSLQGTNGTSDVHSDILSDSLHNSIVVDSLHRSEKGL